MSDVKTIKDVFANLGIRGADGQFELGWGWAFVGPPAFMAVVSVATLLALLILFP